MSKPIIYFKGVKFKAGDNQGVRPQLSKMQDVSDYDFAQEIVLNAGLAMSPDELLMALKSTLQLAPQFVAADGRPRKITDCMTWKGSAKGRISGYAGIWNDSCSAPVKVSIAQNNRAVIDGRFINELVVPTPTINSIAYISAEGVINVIKKNTAFGVYGRYLTMLAGDTAKLVYNGTDYALACTSSDIAQAVFSWPTGLNPEVGAEVVFSMTSRGGVAENEPVTVTKKVVVVEDVVIGPRIDSVKDADGYERATPNKGMTIEGINFPARAELAVATNVVRLMNNGVAVSSVGFDTLETDAAIVSAGSNQIVLNANVWTPLEWLNAQTCEVVIGNAVKSVPLNY